MGMGNFITFVSKEFIENIRTKRILVIACVFLFFAVSSPLLARYIAEFLGLFAGMDELTEGLMLAMPTPHWSDAYTQFYGNLAQVGAFTIILVFIGIILREKRTGTADLVLTKGLTPTVFVLAKFAAAAVVTVTLTLISLGVSHLYTLLLFGEAGSIADVLISGLVFSVFLVLLLGVTMFLSAMVKGTGTGAVLGIAAYFLLAISTSIVSIGPIRIGQHSPGALMLSPIEIAMGFSRPGLPLAVLNSLVITALALWGAVRLTAHKQL